MKDKWTVIKVESYQNSNSDVKMTDILPEYAPIRFGIIQLIFFVFLVIALPLFMCGIGFAVGVATRESWPTFAVIFSAFAALSALVVAIGLVWFKGDYFWERWHRNVKGYDHGHLTGTNHAGEKQTYNYICLRGQRTHGVVFQQGSWPFFNSFHLVTPLGGLWRKPICVDHSCGSPLICFMNRRRVKRAKNSVAGDMSLSLSDTTGTTFVDMKLSEAVELLPWLHQLGWEAADNTWGMDVRRLYGSMQEFKWRYSRVEEVNAELKVQYENARTQHLADDSCITSVIRTLLNVMDTSVKSDRLLFNRESAAVLQVVADVVAKMLPPLPTGQGLEERARYKEITQQIKDRIDRHRERKRSKRAQKGAVKGEPNTVAS